MGKDTFRFKRFDCSHCSSTMKIGVDAVLLGAWASVQGCRKILEVGCGCGVISLICAQRSVDSEVLAIDTDAPSVREASLNFSRSPWSERLRAVHMDFNVADTCNLDMIISNPPYFDSGISNPDTPRLAARHQSELCPGVILHRGGRMLAPGGRIAMIVPAYQLDALVATGEGCRMSLTKALYIKGHEKAPVKRVLAEFTLTGLSSTSAGGQRCSIVKEEIPVMALEISPGVPTGEHRRLCADLYLKF